MSVAALTPSPRTHSSRSTASSGVLTVLVAGVPCPDYVCFGAGLGSEPVGSSCASCWTVSVLCVGALSLWLVSVCDELMSID